MQMDEKKKKKKEEPFIQVVQGDTRSKAAKRSMDLILEKLEHAKKMAKKRQELGF